MATRKKIQATVHDDHIVTEDSDAARELHATSSFGSLTNKQVILTYIEALYLVDHKKLTVYNKRGAEIAFATLLKKGQRTEKNIWTKYVVFKDLRKRGYIVKTGLKFGADFRIYDRGIKPGQDHAKWILYVVPEKNSLTWHDFAGKNRVAHSTKKRLMVGVVDDEHDVTYYEIQWIRP